jgi:hypothetical protein
MVIDHGKFNNFNFKKLNFFEIKIVHFLIVETDPKLR